MKFYVDPTNISAKNKKKLQEDSRILSSMRKLANSNHCVLQSVLSTGLCIIRQGDHSPTGRCIKLGIMDQSGIILFAPQFTNIFQDKDALIVSREGKWGVIQQGVQVTPFHYDAIDGIYSCGRLKVQYHGLWGYIDKAGVEVIPCQFQQGECFNKWRAIVNKAGQTITINTKGETIQTE